MKKKWQTAHLPILFLTLAPLFLQAQNGAGFETYARQHDSIFIALYEKRDTQGFRLLLADWESAYAQLDARERKRFASDRANAHYNLACTYALCGRREPALDHLQQAVEAGFTDYSHLLGDTDLESLRHEPRFMALAESIRAVGDYLFILRHAAAYNPADARARPAFRYDSADKPELKALREKYRLDSVAGSGNDVSQVLNVLHWVHDLIPHDGEHGNPQQHNAQAMIEACRGGKRGLNCRGLATVLNECYLSLGFASRLVTCLPKDSLGIDPDCHVINIVFVPSLGKWIWVDPTYDAWLMNEKGELLDIAEVRERIILDQPLLLNPTANWNHRYSPDKTEYLYQYMAKNLYILQCPVESAWDLETPARGKTIQYVQLLPLDYFKQEPVVREYTDPESGVTYKFYNTNNPVSFWKHP
ncbi:MAG: transglutaminase domain-containing protein [Saprospiraceae bacterium]